MTEALFNDRRLAVLYDHLEGERNDLREYVALLDELTATSILDVGCGTGTLSLTLAAQGRSVVGVDPAEACIEIARNKKGADNVRWCVGEVGEVEQAGFDAAVMTANVAQVFLSDEAWHSTLVEIRERLQPAGHLLFETRDPQARSWETWVPGMSRRTIALPDGSFVDTWHELTEVRLPTVSFRTAYRFLATGEELASESTLRFRSEPEVRDSLSAAGYAVNAVRDAPDRPGKQFVFIAERS